MELDVDVSRLKIMKSAHQSKQFQMEDQLLKYFPEQIVQYQGFMRTWPERTFAKSSFF